MVVGITNTLLWVNDRFSVDSARHLGFFCPSSVNDYRANALARMHEIKPLIDVFQRELVGNQIVYIDLAFHVPIDNLWHVGAPLPAQSGAPPNPTCDELKRTRSNLLSCAGYTNNDAFAPAFVAAFQGLHA